MTNLLFLFLFFFFPPPPPFTIFAQAIFTWELEDFLISLIAKKELSKDT
jgi:hypothetical protein